MAIIPEVGDGQAVFMGQGTEDEWKELQKEDKGFKGIFGLWVETASAVAQIIRQENLMEKIGLS